MPDTVLSTKVKTLGFLPAKSSQFSGSDSHVKRSLQLKHVMPIFDMSFSLASHLRLFAFYVVFTGLLLCLLKSFSYFLRVKLL